MKRILTAIILVSMLITAIVVFASCEKDHTHELTKVEAVEATCTEAGMKVHYTCSGCDKIFSDSQGNKETTKESLVIEAKGHARRLIIGTPATCTEPGISDGAKCSVCDAIIEAQTELEPTGHNRQVLPGFAATCEKSGLQDGEWCPDCEEIFVTRKVIPALDHSWDEGNVTTEATCTSDGVKTFTCTRDSSHTKTDVIPALDHAWDEGRITTEATCTSDGVKTFTCTRDSSHTKTETITASHIPGEEATCDTNQTCTRCFEIIVAALGHLYDNDDDESCNRCDYIREIGCKHARTEILEGYDETCFADGLSDGLKCLDCNETITAQVVIAGGHKFENGSCTRECGYHYLTLNNATVVSGEATLAEGQTNVYIVKEGTSLVIKANDEAKGTIFVGFDKDTKDNRLTPISPVITVIMPEKAVSYTAVYNADYYKSAVNDKNALVSTGWGSGKYTAGSQSGVTATMFKSGDKYTQYGYTGYTFTISSETVLADELIQNITRCNVKTSNNDDRVQRIAKVIFKNNGAFGVTVELAFFRFGYMASTGAVHVGAGETVAVYMELPLLVSDTSTALLGSFIVRGVDEGAEGSVDLDVAVGSARKYADATDDIFVTEDADLVNFETESTTLIGTVENKSHTDGDNRYFDNIGTLHWAYNANMFGDSTYRYISSNIAALTYTNGDEITIYVRLLNYTNTAGMYDNEFEIFAYQGTADSYVELVRETVKLSEDNQEVVVKLTIKPTNENGTIYLGAIKNKTTAEGEAAAAGVDASAYNYNVIMQYAYNNPFGEVDATFAQAE